MSSIAVPSSSPTVAETAAQIIDDVRRRGDTAVREWSERLDNWSPESFALDAAEIERTVAEVTDEVIADLRFCQAQVRRFAEAQRATLSDLEVETHPGVWLGHRHIPVESSGSYVPGGRYPMVASAHMSVITAKVAGVERVVACTPPLDGRPPAATVAAMHLAGADEILIVGGVHALAAMALGTETIGRVSMLVGPGNAYVAEAKRQLFGEVGIDLLAGPSEVLVIADHTADAVTVAADLLAQAEHGPTSPAVLITTAPDLASSVPAEIERQLADLPTAAVAGAAWRDHGRIILVDDHESALQAADELAFEHVEVHTEDPGWFLERLHNYGSLFLGRETTVAFGDKGIGTNHILPTSGATRYTGGLWVGKFLKTVTHQRCTPDAARTFGEVCGRASRLEHFEGHARSCDLRASPPAGRA